ncbi:MAG: chromate efflux transporter [Gammaproteobacteria bacterium]|nr:chromate efflux transporter [Gammaproteobacteria bacterium]
MPRPGRDDITMNGRSPLEVFLVFLKLGCTSFGGPVAHLGYFRDELVVRRRWLDDASYANLVAVCQFLPGPASSQVGFVLGMSRAGLLGGLLAWSAFTLPSALLLLIFAYTADAFGGPVGQSVIHGLKLVAVAVVAHAVWGMARTLCPDRQRATIALGAIALVIYLPTAVGQISAITVGALAGLWCCRGITANTGGHVDIALSRRAGTRLLLVFVLLLGGLPILAVIWPSHVLELFEAFYRAGALVFGGGHVVLPLLEARVVESGWVSPEAFLAGYGAAQAVPGPLFTFAAYLGALDANLGGVRGAAVALVAVFLPGILLVLGVLPYWDHLRQHRFALPLMAGANSAVVGILAAALYSPVWTSAILTPSHFLIGATAFILLAAWGLAPWIVVLVTVLASVLLGVG